MSTIDPNNYEPGAIQLTLRRDLTFRQQVCGGERCYVIEDSTTSRFYRIGEPEHAFLSLLDGQTSIAKAVAETATASGDTALTEKQAAALCRWLVDNALASTPQSGAIGRLNRQADIEAGQRRREWLNPLMLKMPLGRPQPTLKRLASFLGLCFSYAGVLFWAAIVLFGGYCLWAEFDRFAASTASLLSQDSWIWLGITWLVLKLLHETAHGIACCRFGGETREAGVLLLLFVPLPYVDVTSSWRFGSKWERIVVSAAGMYVEIFVAAAAAIVWTSTDSAVVQFHACNIVVTAGFMTLLFNMNPLMRFDGYYLLSDACNLPNLATHGQQDVVSLARRWLLGSPESAPRWPEGQAVAVRCYGLAALVWKCVVMVSLTVAAARLYHGAGIVLAAVAVFYWLLSPTMKFVRYLIVGDLVNPPERLRFAAIMFTGVAFAGGIWHFVPYIERVQLPATVGYDPVIDIRSATSGFVRKIYVQSGQSVVAGQKLFTLANVDLVSRIQRLELALKTSRLDATQYHRQHQLAAFQVEQENEAAIKKRLDELQKQAMHLTLFAPVSGTVLTRCIDDYAGQWVTAGTELLQIGNEATRSVRFVVGQSDVEVVRAARDQPVTVYLNGTDTGGLAGVISAVEPRGSTTLKYPSLAAVAGGPLPVQRMPHSGRQATESNSPPIWQLLEPYFNGQVTVQSKALQSAGTGQVGVVEIVARRGSIGSVLTAWVENQFKTR